MSERQEWWASGAGIVRCGPFGSEREAREAMRLTDKARAEQMRSRGTASPYPFDLCVWPEARHG